MKRLDLDGKWDVVERPLNDGVQCCAEVSRSEPSYSGPVPGDVSDWLVRAGQMPEPLVGLKFRDFQWVEERSWWFRRTLTVPMDWRSASRVELRLDGLDVHGDVWLNEHYLGHHISAFHPFIAEVRDWLKWGGENQLIVRLTCGLENVPKDADENLLAVVPTEAPRGYPDRIDPRRIYLRKPAYAWGWDWGPRLATCGITGHCELTALGENEITDVALNTTLDGTSANVTADIRIERATLLASAWATVQIELTDKDGKTCRASRENVFIPAGTSYHHLSVEIPDVRLWWPNGSGEQHLYRVNVTARVGNGEVACTTFRYGVRTVRLHNTPGSFCLMVNNTPLFAKGGNTSHIIPLFYPIQSSVTVKKSKEKQSDDHDVEST